jgi:uncharacterized delta-60 repeat protein
MLIGGRFTSYNGKARNNIARIDPDGSLDPNFRPGSGANNLVRPVAVQADGKVLIGGWFTSYNDTGRNRIARLTSDGNLDTSFNPGTGPNNVITSIVVQTDEKVLIAGVFTSYSGTTRNRIARLNRDGSLDPTFPGSGANDTVYSVVVQTDGKLLISGAFTNYNGSGRNYIARLNSNGSLDTSFNPGNGVNSSIGSLAVQADGKVLIAGDFTSYNGTPRTSIARLQGDGSLDTSFDPGPGATWNGVSAIALQPDGKVLIVPIFGRVQGRLIRLNGDGSLDASFTPGTGADNQIESIALQADGKVLVSGDFALYHGTARDGIARLNSDGGLDTTFNPGTGANNRSIDSLAVQADGKVLIGGTFTIYNDTARSYLARLANDPSIQNILVPNLSQVQWLRGGAAPEVEQVSFEYSADGASWITLGAGTRINGGWELTGLSLSGTGYIRARGRANGGQYNGSSSVIEQVYGFNDADLDGLLDSWELTYRPTINGHKASDDFDGDGMPELLELAFGLNPTIADAALQPLVVVEGGYLTITITNHAGVTYEVQTAGTLLSGRPDSFSPASTTVLINNATTLKVRDNFPLGSASDRYLRVKVTAAP